VIHTVVDPAAERYGEVDVERLETVGGPAWTVRWRPVRRGADGERLVHEQHAVLWPDRDHEMVLALSVYVLDLVEGATVAEPLHELARSVQWSLT
jgi:hypothetical protein